MIIVGICDDGVNICADLEEMVLQYAGKNKIQIDTKVYYSGEELCDDIKKGYHLDILFLDIELYEQNGMQVGDYIRNGIEDRMMQIIYISGSSSYAQELFKTQPMDFLIKPITMKQMEDSLHLAIKLIEKNKGRFEYHNGKEHHFISYGDIIYFESKGRKMKVVSFHAEQEFYGKIKELEKALSKDFIMIHQSYVINRMRVRRYTYEMVEMDDGAMLPISKAYRKQVRERLLRG